MQRVVLLLRDVFDYSARETAKALAISEANARTLHLRARRAMSAYDAERTSSTHKRHEAAKTALERFMTCVAEGDVAGFERLLAADARTLTDGGGEFHAGTGPVTGRKNVALLFVGLSKKSTAAVRMDLQTLNGQPAFIIQRLPREGFASKFVLTGDVDANGRLTRIYVVLASRKLTSVH